MLAAKAQRAQRGTQRKMQIMIFTLRFLCAHRVFAAIIF